MKRELTNIQKLYSYLNPGKFSELELMIINIMNKSDYMTKPRIKQLVIKAYFKNPSEIENLSWNFKFEKLINLGIIVSLRIENIDSSECIGYKLSSYI